MEADSLTSTTSSQERKLSSSLSRLSRMIVFYGVLAPTIRVFQMATPLLSSSRIPLEAKAMDKEVLRNHSFQTLDSFNQTQFSSNSPSTHSSSSSTHRSNNNSRCLHHSSNNRFLCTITSAPVSKATMAFLSNSNLNSSLPSTTTRTLL